MGIERSILPGFHICSSLSLKGFVSILPVGLEARVTVFSGLSCFKASLEVILSLCTAVTDLSAA